MFIKAVSCLILHKKIVFDSKDHLDFFMKSAVMSENRNVVLASKVNGRGHRLCAKNAAQQLCLAVETHECWRKEKYISFQIRYDLTFRDKSSLNFLWFGSLHILATLPSSPPSTLTLCLMSSRLLCIQALSVHSVSCLDSLSSNCHQHIT